MTIHQTAMRRVNYVELLFSEYYADAEGSKNGNPREVNARDVTTLVLPRGCFAFRFFDRYEGVCEGEAVTSGRVDESVLYLVGVKMSVSEVEEYFPKRDDVVKKMNACGATHVVHCPAGKEDVWHIWDEDDKDIIILSPKDMHST